MERKCLCGKLIKQLHDELERQANNTLIHQNLTLTQMHVLMELEAATEHHLPLKELERVLHVAQSTAAGIVARLAQKGYVESLSDADDRRVKHVIITPSGIECCKNAKSHIDDMEGHLLSGLTEEEKEQFCRLLQKICDR